LAIRLLPGDVLQAAELLKKGGLVAFPTETVYGLGADALNPGAVARVFEAKERPSFDPLIVHISDWDMLVDLVTEIAPLERRLMQQLWPGPLTIVMPKSSVVPDLVTAGLPRVGVRWPDHTVAQSLIELTGRPIAAPSANRFGGISPTTADHVLDQLGDRIDAVIDGGPCQVGLESTVVEVRADTIAVLRLGGVTVETLSRIAKVEVDIAHVDKLAQSAPGRMARHYAPATPLEIQVDLRHAPPGADVGVLAFRDVELTDRFGRVEILSPAGLLNEAATNFFAALRRLDAAGLRLIVAERFPDEGLGRALNDRLQRASHR
jgi:L-threonylcarbamoyladenylate synthase